MGRVHDIATCLVFFHSPGVTSVELVWYFPEFR